MKLTTIEESLLVAAFFRGGRPSDTSFGSNSDQIVTLSLFYTEDLSSEECVRRFSRRGYVGELYDENGELKELVKKRYRALIQLIRQHPEIISGGGDLELPADPTFTACRLTDQGQVLARSLMSSLPQKPEFPDWPDFHTTDQKEQS